MEQINKLANSQSEVGKAMEKLLTNMKKDSEARKTRTYINERKSKLRILWEKAVSTNTEIATLEIENHVYHTTNYFEQMCKLNTHINNYLADLEKKLPSTPQDDNGADTEQEQRLKRQEIRIQQLESRLQNIEGSMGQEVDISQLEMWQEQIQQQITAIEKLDEDIQVYETKFEDKYFSGEFETIKQWCDMVSIRIKNNVKTKKEKTCSIKLPTIKLPIFSGGYENWMAFQDIYEKVIHANNSITTVEKMQYLKGNVTGEAAKLIQHLQIAECNYETAWETLKNRYNNKRLTVKNLINKILDFPTIQQEAADAVKRLHDTIHECMAAITNLGIDTNSWGPIIAHIIARKWDTETNKLFEQSQQKPHEIPSIEEVMEFLKVRFQSLEAMSQERKQKYVPERGQNRWQPSRQKCAYCKQDHRLSECTTFKGQPAASRLAFVREKHLCYNCMGHNSSTKCYSPRRCTTCQYPHHTLLHQEYKKPTTHTPTKTTAHAATKEVINTRVSKDKEVLLATAMVRTKDVFGNVHMLRVLIDPGSQASFITEDAAQSLNIPRQKVQAEISGLGGATPTKATTKITIQLRPRHASIFSLTTEVIVLKKITENLPMKPFEFDTNQWTNQILADPTLNKPGPVDVLLGAEDYAKLILNGVRKTNDVLGQNSELGWILSGQIHTAPKQEVTIISMITREEEHAQLEKFWELEEIPGEIKMSQQDKECEEHYQQNTMRNSDGTYTVKVPFKEDPDNIEKSKPLAVARFLQVEKKFMRDARLEQGYKKFMEEYLQLGHMKPATNPGENRVYIPHQAVIKESSTTTKLRVVFDASSKGSNGKSLNQMMHVGPRLQQDLWNLLIRWRKHRYVITADIEKMYRQIKLHKEDHRYHTILWRPTPREPIKEYQLTTVTYGTAAAPYLAVRTLQQLARDEEISHPQASAVSMKDFYVDDLLTGAKTIEEAKSLQEELITLFSKGGFTLRKWASNHKNLWRDGKEKSEPMDIKQDDSRKSLGVRWHPKQDNFQFKVELSNKAITKRNILSETAKIFDPLGWVSPVTIKAKMIIQEVWASTVKWDQQVPTNIAEKWIEFRKELNAIEEIQIPRWIHHTHDELQLHGFCDASEKAYGAVIYTRTNQGQITMLTAKSKVAPIKTKATIPKLELSAALLLAKLLKRTADALEIPNITTFAWSDSMITLAWIKGDPTRWKTFVANRVTEINTLVPHQKWNHVRTEENPADMLSRGYPASKMKTESTWWNGPEWLKKDEWKTYLTTKATTDLEMKRCLTATKIENDNSIIDRFSSLQRLQRVISYCNRFNKACKGQRSQQKYLELEELHRAMHQVIMMTQRQQFSIEIKTIQTHQQVQKNNQISTLNPFIDGEGIMRVGGRLHNTQLSFNEKHPIILPPKQQLTKLVILEAHQKTLHGGIQITLAYLRRKYWIINGKKAVKSIIHSCTTCIRYKKQTVQQLMGELPAARVTPNSPFTHTGVDYAGPIQIRSWKGRGHKAYKGYIAIFICLTTKAIHLEVVSDMSTETFIAALRRFIARRGHCAHMYSDNGTNFVGTNNMIQTEIQKIINEVGTKETTIGIKWHFIPPSTPHMGGLWEAGVKSVKHHMKRVIGETTLTYEELTTLMHQIEACLNSRPLVPITTDPGDMILTPGHFLIGEALVGPSNHITDSIEENLSARWKLIQRMKANFWKTWSSEYLSSLQQRYKWKQSKENMSVNDIVLVKEDNIHPAKWPLEKITNVHTAEDGKVRVVTTQKSDGKFTKRHIHNLVPVHSPTKTQAEHKNNKTRQIQRQSPVLQVALGLLTMLAVARANFTIVHPQPGLYIEHIGNARIGRGTFRIDLQYNKASIEEDIMEAINTTQGFNKLCSQATKISKEIHCKELTHHTSELGKQLEWLQEGIHTFVHTRKRRGMLGDILTSIFGVNDEVYKDINTLNKNQQELIKTADRQTKFMLSALSTFNNTETRINTQLISFKRKLNLGLEAIANMEKWYKTIDENQINMHILNTYQLAVNLVNEVYTHYTKILDASRGRGSLNDLITEKHIKELVTAASRKLPSNIEVLTHPIIEMTVKQDNHQIYVSGYFRMAEVAQYVIMKITPVPLRMDNGTYGIMEVGSGIIAVEYNTQQYFQLTDGELRNSASIGKHTIICTPTVVNSIEQNPNCVIDQLYQRTNENSCRISVHRINGIIWKQLYMPNTWMFITKEAVKAAVMCNGVRQDVTLNKTGIIQTSSECLVKTKQSILSPIRQDSVSVLTSYHKPVHINITEAVQHTNTNSIKEEIILTATDQLSDLKHEEETIQEDVGNTHWEKMSTHATVISVSSTATILGAVIASWGAWKLWKRLQQKKQPSTTEEQCKLETLYAIPDATSSPRQNVQPVSRT